MGWFGQELVEVELVKALLLTFVIGSEEGVAEVCKAVGAGGVGDACEVATLIESDTTVVVLCG